MVATVEYGIDLAPWINVASRKFDKKSRHSLLKCSNFKSQDHNKTVASEKKYSEIIWLLMGGLVSKELNHFGAIAAFFWD